MSHARAAYFGAYARLPPAEMNVARAAFARCEEAKELGLAPVATGKLAGRALDTARPGHALAPWIRGTNALAAPRCLQYKAGVQLRLKRVGDVEVPLPEYATSGAAGLDLRAALRVGQLLRPGARCLIPTGIALELPAHYEGQVRPRSGLALKHGVTVLNAPGTIDSDYRGEVSVVLINCGAEVFTVEPMMRIAQLVVAPVIRVQPEWVEVLSDSPRGAGGYGSTGAV